MDMDALYNFADKGDNMLRDITVEYRNNPIGLDTLPRFSWKIISKYQNVLQVAYQIIVKSDTKVMWNSGRVESEQSVLVEYTGKKLVPTTAYKVEIAAWDNKGELHQGDTFFETGLIKQENWKASWISHEWHSEETFCPVFSKKIKSNKKKLKAARIYATACGVYEITIDGKKVGDTFFAPGWTSYHNRIQYQTYDITELLLHDIIVPTSEKNIIEITVGNGWYKGYLNGEGEKAFYGDTVALLAMIRLEYEDGNVELIGTDETWGVSASVIKESEIYHGETQDFTMHHHELALEKSGNAILSDVSEKINEIISQESESIRITKYIQAKKLIRTPKGEMVIDFGQNMAGLVAVRLPALLEGANTNKIVIRHGETLDKEGNFYNANLRTAKATDTYIYGIDMVDKVVMPHFTYHGFRYICIEGAGSDIDISRFTACVMHTDMENIGSFSCDNEKINQLQHNIEWGQRSNFFDIPTDCPQRDERLGWTGDAQIFCATGSYNFNTSLFFQKWLRDVAVESGEKHGVPHMVPNIVGPTVGTAVWSDCATIVPWQVYESFGDRKVLEEQYPLMKLWVEYIRKQSGDSLLWMNGFQRGDWLALDAPASRPALMSGGTDKNLVANIYYAVSTRIVRDAAKILGFIEDEKIYSKLYNTIVEEINDEYVTKHGRLVSETQTACALLLHFNILKEEHRNKVIEILEENLMNHKNHLTTGFVGTAYLCHALTENGRHHIAEEVFLQQGFPGWIYAIEKGATTIWERWNSVLPNGDFDESGMNSLNHYTFGAIGDWMYRKIAGINPAEPGYKKILIKPTLTRSMTEVEGTLETMYGKVRCAWTCKNGRITVDVEIPANTTAILMLPEKDGELEIGSGCYHYEYDTMTSLDIGKFSKNTTFGEILENDKAKEVLYQVMPEMNNNPMISFVKEKTIGEMSAMSLESTHKLEKLLQKLNML